MFGKKASVNNSSRKQGKQAMILHIISNRELTVQLDALGGGASDIFLSELLRTVQGNFATKSKGKFAN
jgi:hypothetical protein